MSNVSVEDNGKYAFSCLPDESEKEMMATVEDKQIFYCLNVLDIPRAGLFVPGHRHALFLVGHSYGLRCAITANPDPEKVVWSVCNQSGDTCTQNTFWMTKNTSQVRLLTKRTPRGSSTHGRHSGALLLIRIIG